MQWFRHYVGAVRDPKFTAVAAKTRQPIERIVWTYFALLESCSEHDAPAYRLDADEAAYFLRCDPADLGAILDGLDAAGLIADGQVVAWQKRQFKSDKSTDRVRAYRERKRRGNGDETFQKREVTPPESESETDSDPKTKAGRGKARETDIAEKFFSAIGIRRNVQTRDRQTVSRWLAAGYTEAEILAVAKAKADALATKTAPAAYCDRLIADEIAKLRDAQAAEDRALEDPQRSRWRAILAACRDGAPWPRHLGPAPGEPGCPVPPHMLEPSDA